MAEESNRTVNLKDLVSVIIPVYKTEAYLSDCLDSVINQSYKNLEIIIVDDGSPDSSSVICDDYASVDNRIKVIHKENGGLSSARNAGIDICSGKYITFVDSDDIIADTMVEEMLSIAVSEKADVVKIGVIRKYNYCENIAITKGYKSYTGKEALHLIFKSNSQIICGCGKLFTREVVGENRFPLGRYYEDEYFVPRVYNRANKVVLSESELYFYMQRDNDSILRGKFSEKKIMDSIWISQDRLCYIKSIGDINLIRMAKIDYYYKLKFLLSKIDNSGEFNHVADLLKKYKKEFAKQNPSLILYIQIKHVLFTIYHKFKTKE